MTKKSPDCAIWKSNECLASWIKKKGWTVVSSLKYPMGPVVDYRWEGKYTHMIIVSLPLIVVGNIIALRSTKVSNKLKNKISMIFW